MRQKGLAVKRLFPYRDNFCRTGKDNDPCFDLIRQDRIEDGEERWQTIGVVYGVTVLLVAHTVTEGNDDRGPVETIRIISARRATPRERKHYEQESR